MPKKYKNGAVIIPPVGRLRGGINLPHRKLSAEVPTTEFPIPKSVTLQMLQHIGAPCTPIVKVGDEVFVGQKIADSDSPVSTPIHSSVSGTVRAITRVQLPSGNFCDAVEIEADGKQTPHPDIAPPQISCKEDLIKAVHESGIVGLGGAGFPTHIKLNPRTEVDTLIINAAECEPYITSDYRAMVETPDDVLFCISLIKKYYDIKKVVIVIEDNKPDAIKTLADKITEQNLEDVFVMPVRSAYPRGAEKITLFVATGRVVPEGKLPADVGCIVMNVTTAATIAQYVHTGMPLISRRMTVSGEGVKKPQNLIIPIGTKISDILEFCEVEAAPTQKIISGGPMMGISLQDDDLPTIKQNNSLLVLSEKESTPAPMSACIRCGRCAAACTMSLLPAKVERDLKLGDTSALAGDHVMNCMECGSCAFSCPAKRPLVQVMRQAKATLKKEAGK